MDRQVNKTKKRDRRRVRIRRKVIGTPSRPRLAVFKSLKHIYVQVIDDLAGHTLASASTRDSNAGKGGNAAAAALIGAQIAERAKAAGVSQVVFDRAGFRYHGRIKALADAARKAGLEF
jgi:large subunit ribosomal protein L18